MLRPIVLAGLFVVGACVLGTTVFRDQVASAGGQRTHRLARHTAQPPTPVAFTNGSGVSTGNTVKIDPTANGVNVTNTDGSGNVKVHEQGTANVSVTNSSLTAAPRVATKLGCDSSIGASTNGTFTVLCPLTNASLVTVTSQSGPGFITFYEAANTNDDPSLQFDLEAGHDLVVPLPEAVPIDRVEIDCRTSACSAVFNIVGS
jgi:hypothetical protein